MQFSFLNIIDIKFFKFIFLFLVLPKRKYKMQLFVS